MFGWLPTGRQLQRRDANKSGRCPSCTAHQETGEHILRCRHPERIKVWLSWKASFETQLAQWHTCPDLALLLRRGLASFYNGHNHNMVTADCCGQIRKLADIFNTLGWQQLFHGRLPILMVKIQQAYNKRRRRRKRLAIQTWTTRVIHKLWEVIFKQWETQNEVIHPAQDSPEMHEKAWKALRGTYALQNSILPTDLPRLYPRTLTQWQDTSPSEILLWCEQVKPALENSRQCFIAQNRKRNRLVTEFFQPR